MRRFSRCTYCVWLYTKTYTDGLKGLSGQKMEKKEDTKKQNIKIVATESKICNDDILMKH